MPGTFAYTKSTNRLVVTDGTSGAPATFNDMYTADQAGTVELLAAWSPDNNTKALTYQLTPALAKGLKIDFVVASKTTEADYIFVTGTDIDGGAQTESLDVSAGNGTYTTTKWFATITNIDCSDNAAGGGTVWADGTVQVIQNQWGIVWEILQDVQYKVDCDVHIGDASTSTYFAITNEQCYIVGYVKVTTNATFRCGSQSVSAGEGAFGAALNMEGVSNDPSFCSGGTIVMYNCLVHFRDSHLTFQTGSVSIYNAIFTSNEDKDNNWVIYNTMTDATTHDIYVYNLAAPSVRLAAASVSGFTSEACNFGAKSHTVLATMTDLLARNFGSKDIQSEFGGDCLLIDPRFHITTPAISTADNWIKEQYTCNIHIVDINGADFPNVDVDCEYAHLVEGSDSKTYKCIADHTAVDAEHKPITGTDWATYWELYDASGGLGGDWDTGFAYKSGTEEFSTATTDANGDISEQVIDYKKWIDTTETLEARIHKFTLSNSGETVTLEDYIVDHPIVWHFKVPFDPTKLDEIINRLKRISYTNMIP